MTTKTTAKSTTKRTPAKSTAKTSNTTTVSKKIAKITTTSSKESVEIVPNLTFKSTNILTKNGESTNFFLETYSQRCMAITAENFETVYYLAFLDEKAAIDFVNAIIGKFCLECSLRPSKRFNRVNYPFEVKVWGMTRATFFRLVKRDLARK